jgi:hypothetical protein
MPPKKKELWYIKEMCYKLDQKRFRFIQVANIYLKLLGMHGTTYKVVQIWPGLICVWTSRTAQQLCDLIN